MRRSKAAGLNRRMMIGAVWLTALGPGAARAAGGPVISRQPGGAYAAQSGAATFTIGNGGRVVPPSFLGFSTEYDELSAYENAGPVFDRVVAMLRPQDGSPMLLRLGGKSADHTFWETFPPNYPRQVIKLRVAGGDGVFYVTIPGYSGGLVSAWRP